MKDSGLAPAHAAAIAHKADGKSAAIIILAIAAFVIVTTEFLIVGLLPGIALDLSISVSATGQLVTLFAVVVMLLGPVLTASLSHLERKRLFVVILVLFAAANGLAALAPNIWVLAIARVIPALALPVFWGTASESAAQIAGPERSGRAVSTVYLGISAAMLFGIPLGTVAANSIGWRGAFAMLAGLSLLIAVLIQKTMPTLPTTKRQKLGEQARILRDPYFVANVALSIVVFTAMFTAYTYLAEALERVAGIAPSQVGWWMMGFGAVGLIGNWLAGSRVEKHPLSTTAAFCVLLAIGMTATMAFAYDLKLLAIALTVWGIANTALYPVCQIRVMQSAKNAQALAGTLNVSAANGGIALGALIGGLSLPVWGVQSVGYVAAAVALVAVLTMPFIARLKR